MLYLIEYFNKLKWKIFEKYCSKAPLKRMANEEDFIGAFPFLSTDMSLYVTGQTLKIDGGWGLS